MRCDVVPINPITKTTPRSVEICRNEAHDKAAMAEIGLISPASQYVRLLPNQESSMHGVEYPIYFPELDS